jgi:hypothetical protein
MATNTYVALDKVTVGTATPSVTFSSISGLYTDLFVEMNIQGVAGSGSGANTVFLTFNGDTTSGLYSRTILLADSGGAQSSRTTGQNRINLGNAFESASASNTFGTHLLNIQNYSNSTTFKTVLNRYSSNADRVGAVVGLWRNTNAITSLTITVDSSTGNIAAGSTFLLYGIAAEGIAAKATGGAIYADSTYWYHVFGSSGTFTPSQSLSADVLVVAGGGGGGCDDGGAGGAGGLCFQSSRSLTATGYTVTIGAGGTGSNVTSISGTTGSNSVFDTITANGGGGGGTGLGDNGSKVAKDGGSGGGQAYGGGAVGATNQGTSGGATGYGNNGGTSTSSSAYGTGGGGGAGGVGANGTTTVGGAGGVGLTAATIPALNVIGAATGTGQLVSGNYYYAGGGGGSIAGTNAPGAGGSGGGGRGSNTSVLSAIAGTTNTGGGGGGGVNVGAAGGSGIVIVRYAK